jgi:hypothetical protein
MLPERRSTPGVQSCIEDFILDGAFPFFLFVADDRDFWRELSGVSET